MNFKSMRRVLNLASSAAAAALVAGTAYAITETNFKYSTPQTGFYAIDSMAMAPDGTAAADDYFNSWGGGITASDVRCFNTSVNLPDNATITNLTVYTKSSETGSPGVYLFRHRLSDGKQHAIASADLPDMTDTRVGTSIAAAAKYATVKNEIYSYGFGTCISNASTFFSARITYTYTSAGD